MQTFKIKQALHLFIENYFYFCYTNTKTTKIEK